jgi:hypothetical protein
MRNPLSTLAAARGRWWILTPFVAITAALSVGAGALGPLGGVSRGIGSLELAGCPTHAKTIVDAWDRAGLLGVARASVGWDYPFLVAYSTTLAFACLIAAAALRRRGSPWDGVAQKLAWLQWVAGGLDVVENLALLRMLAAHTASPWPQIAFACAAPKFILIGSGLLFLVVVTLFTLARPDGPLLRKRGLPYLLTALFGVAAWGTSHAVDSILVSPAIELSTSVVTTGEPLRTVCDQSIAPGVPQRRIAFVAANLSRDPRLHDLEATVECQSKNCRLLGFETWQRPQASSGTATEPACDHDSATLFIPKLEPHWNMRLVVDVAGGGNPSLQFHGWYESVRLVPPSPATCLVQHEGAIIGTLAVVWLLLAGAYGTALVRRSIAVRR